MSRKPRNRISERAYEEQHLILQSAAFWRRVSMLSKDEGRALGRA
jgi:hypothetical protein